MKIIKLLEGIKYRSSKSLAGAKVSKVTCDSRGVKKGDLFIAFRGFADDGYKYIPQAISNGASAVLSEKDFEAPEYVIKILVGDTRAAFPVLASNMHNDPSRNLKMFGITGTNGKTTITYIIENIFGNAGCRTGVIGTINYRFKDKIVPAKNTTPGPLELQCLLFEMTKAGVSHVAMEVSSHSLDQGRVNGISFDAAIFTNITGDHLDYHKTINNYFRAKVKLFGKLKKSGTAILNHDDKLVRSLAGKLKSKVLTYGLSKGADIRAVDVKLSLDGSRFTIQTPKGDIPVSVKLIGRHNVSNILAAAGAAYCEGLSFSAIKKGVESVGFAPGRLEPVSAGQPFKVFVDFAHTQDALFNILGLLRDVTQEGRIITVFGCGGNRDRAKRPLMGITACEFSNKVVITSDNPRHEEPSAIIEEIEKGVRRAYKNYEVVVDRRKAIEKALREAGEKDIVVIAGKGHEKYQIIKDEVTPFDDREVARELIRVSGIGVRGPGK